MGPLSAGQIVFVPFTYSDLSRSKRRPVLLLAEIGRGDWIVCQITSNPLADPFAITLTVEAFESGSLLRTSYVRPLKTTALEESLFHQSIGTVRPEILREVRDVLIRALQG